MNLQPLLTVTASGVIETLGSVQGGERIKIEYRGATGAGSLIDGKAHGTDWVLVGPLGPGETNSVVEIRTAEKDHLVLELRGYATAIGGGYEVRSAGLIRTAATRFTDLNGKVVVAITRVGADQSVGVIAYHF
jgi:hypothetical protein